ncbi:hypothetical protein F4778DRAFT_749991 [Xylariomycetidae sp. FL2044]|nr:hypothetical protein F4778DRAFT_749991 [Xylariomycetidae sp. FL2044]
MAHLRPSYPPHSSRIAASILRISSILLYLATLSAAVEYDYSNASLITDEDDALLLLNAGGLGPRFFQKPVPALPALLGRQEPFQCPAGNHSCLELGSVGALACCGDTDYCFLDRSGTPACCALGSTCPNDSPCPEDSLFCNSTLTTGTTTVPVSSAATQDPSNTITVIEQTTVTETCCGRPCSSSSFLCQQAFGGQCCKYGYRCASGGLCLSTLTPTTTSVPGGSGAPPLVPGCTTSQFSCPASEGGGCCGIGSKCTSQAAGATWTPVCAPDLNITSSDSGSLSPAGRAGIGAGVAIGAAAVIGGLTWFCLRRRKRQRAASRPSRGHGGMGGDAGGAAGSVGVGGLEGESLVEPYMRDRDGTISEFSGPLSAGLRPQVHATGLAVDYFGPDPVVGPYTSYSNRPQSRTSPGQFDRGVPANPEGPGDIVAPVEIGSSVAATTTTPETRKMRGEKEGLLAVGGGAGGTDTSATPSRDEEEKEPEGPFELAGSPPPGSPSPMSRDDGGGRGVGPYTSGAGAGPR